MADLRAFVGHSFTEDDASVVGAFLKYLARISEMNQNFSWVHAEAAEPKELKEKVLSLIEDRNLFIGICTKKEMVLSPSQIVSFPFWPKRSHFDISNVQWKTSDWIIQEIGLAVGRNLSLILLIEKGLRKPGGLQGNVEYIEFEREHPERSFGKLLEMLSSLSPKSGNSGSQTLPAAPVAKDSLRTENTEDWTTPKPDWTYDAFDIAMFHFLMNRNPGKAAEIDKAFLASPLASNSETLAVWNSSKQFALALSGSEQDSLSVLEETAREYPKVSEVRANLARTLRHFKKNREAAIEFEAAAECEANLERQIELFGDAAKQYFLAQDKFKYASIQNRIREMGSKGRVDERVVLLALHRNAENRDLFALALSERLLNLAPSNHDARFQLAYEYSQEQNEDLALHHYRNIPVRERREGVWNNLGTVWDHFAISGKAVSAFKQAGAMGQALALSNLGFKYLNAGFLEEAQAVCDKALLVKDYPTNVGRLLTKIKETPEDEEEKAKELEAAVAPKIEFFTKFGRAVSLPCGPEIEGVWSSKEGDLSLTFVSDQISLSGTVVRPANSLALLTALGVGALSTPSTEKVRIEIKGEIRGKAIVAAISRETIGVTRTMLGSVESKLMMYLSDDNTEIFVLDGPSSSSPTFYSMKRK